MSNKISFMYNVTINVDENAVLKYLNETTSLDTLGIVSTAFIEKILENSANKTITEINVNYLFYDDNKGVEN